MISRSSEGGEHDTVLVAGKLLRWGAVVVLVLLVLAAMRIAAACLECRRTPERLTAWSLSEVALVSDLRAGQEAFQSSHGVYTADPSDLPISLQPYFDIAITDATASGYTATVHDDRTGLVCLLTVDRRAPRPNDVVLGCRRQRS